MDVFTSSPLSTDSKDVQRRSSPEVFPLSWAVGKGTVAEKLEVDDVACWIVGIRDLTTCLSNY